MPSWKWHVSRSVSDKKKAFEIAQAMDGDPLNLFTHHVWRKHTHNPLAAIMIGYSVNGSAGAADALSHILDDEIYNAMFRKQKNKPPAPEPTATE